MEAAELRPPWLAAAEAANHCLAAQIWQPAPERAPPWEYQTGMEVSTAVARRDHNRQGPAAPEVGPECAEPAMVHLASEGLQAKELLS